MKNPTPRESRKRLATIIAVVLLITLAAFDLFSTLNYFSQPNTILLLTMALSYVATVCTAVCTWLIRIERVDAGLWGLIFTNLTALFLSPFLGSGLGIPYAITAIVVTVGMSQALDPKYVGRAILIGLVFGIAIVLLDSTLPSSNTANANNGFTYIILIFLIVALVFIVARQFAGYNLRNKLLVAFVSVTIVATGTLAVYAYISTNNILRQGLERELMQHADGIAVSIGGLLDTQIDLMTTLSANEVLQRTVEEQNKTYEGDASAIKAALDERDAQWRSADAADNNFDPLVREYLNNQAALELREFQKASPNNVEIFITDVFGGQAGTTNRTSDYLQSDEGWWQAAYNNGEGAVYISEPEFDESANALAVLIALPLRQRGTGEIIGILRTTYLASALNNILNEPVGNTGNTDILFPGEVASHFHAGEFTQIAPEEYASLQAVAGRGMAEINYENIPSVIVQTPVRLREDNQAVDNLGWVILFHQQQDEAFAPISGQTRGVLLVMAIILVLAVGAATGFSLVLGRPIAELTRTAEEVAAGNLNSRAPVTSTDEVGILASTFNSMTSQLQETLQGLEARVAARTRDLEIVAEVGTATSTILESKRLLQDVVDLTKERFNLYHSHIYLLDEKGENLVLAAGAGEPGRVMAAEGRAIPLNREQSLVARAARKRMGVTVNDVTQAPDFLPNPLLPDTRSELAVPMIVGGKVIGVFDVQSEQVGRFTDSDVNIQTTLAAQVATSIQNAHSFEQSRKQAEFEAMVNTIGQKIQRATSIEETLQTAIRELGASTGAWRVKAKIGRSDGDN